MEKGFTRIFWQALCVGLLTGLLIVLFRLGIENMFEFVMVHFYAAPLLFLLITTLGGLAAGFVVYKFAPETSGSGIPYVKMSLLKSGRHIRIRTIFVKFIAGAGNWHRTFAGKRRPERSAWRRRRLFYR